MRKCLKKKMHIPLLRLSYTNSEIQFVKDGVEEILKSGYLTMASKVKEFEKSFAKWVGTRYSIGTNSGTSSIEIPLRIVGVKGKTVVCPSNTYMATPLAAIKAGARVIFTDCEKENLQMCPADLERKIQKDTKAVILVHIGGIISPRFDEIKRICRDNKISLIEDAAHAHGATYKNAKAGSLGIAGAFSFYPTKVLTTAEGGMITTNNKDLYERAKVFREHGKEDSRFNVHTEIGDNWRFSELHAILGLQQMRKADSILADRRRIATQYDELLADFDVVERVIVPPENQPAYYKYILLLPDYVDRQAVKARMREEYDVELTGEVYSDPCHSQPLFKRYPDMLANKKNDKFPATDYVCKHHICLPIYPGLRDEEVEYVVDCLKKVI